MRQLDDSNVLGQEGTRNCVMRRRSTYSDWLELRYRRRHANGFDGG